MVAGPSILDDSEIEAMSARFAEDGVAWTPPLLSPDEVAHVRRNVDRYISQFRATLPHPMIRFEADGVAVRSLYVMDRFDLYFRDFGNSPRFKELVGKVAGFDAQLFSVETFNKEPRIGSAAPPHQDSAFLKDHAYVVTLWISLDRVSKENGPVRYWRGSHRNGLLPHVEHLFGLQVAPTCVDSEADLLVRETGPGEAALHSGLVVHDSPANTTHHPRLGIVCTYKAQLTSPDTP